MMAGYLEGINGHIFRESGIRHSTELPCKGHYTEEDLGVAVEDLEHTCFLWLGGSGGY